MHSPSTLIINSIHTRVIMSLNKVKEWYADWREDLDELTGNGRYVRFIEVGVSVYLLCMLGLGFYWSTEPELFEPEDYLVRPSVDASTRQVTGYATTMTLIKITEALLDKQGGYISNDVFPPGVWLDNINYWEKGVLVQVRDLARSFRNDFSRSQSQSVEDEDLAIAEPQFFFNSDSWILPPTEDEYRQGVDKLEHYLVRLTDPQHKNAQFFARADNLRNWLAEVETRLGSLSQRLSASVGKRQLNIDLAGDAYAVQATEVPKEEEVKTAWTELDDIFYEARGSSWALIHILKAVEVDFREVLQKKNALVSLRQIIRELEGTQEAVWSPVILNGSGFGFVANHSLVMASYVSRANAAIIDLRTLLSQG